MAFLNYRIPEVKRAVETKCGIVFKGTNEEKGWYMEGERKEFLVLLPRHNAPLKKGTARSVAKQLKLTNAQFKDLVDCPMGSEQYHAHIAELREEGRI